MRPAPLRLARSVAIPVAVYLGIVVLWQLAGTSAARTPGSVLAAPSEVLETIWDMRVALVINARTTLAEAGLGLAAGTVVALGMSILIDRFRLAGEGFYRVALLFHAIPLIAIAAPLVAWLGLGFETKVVVAATGAYFPVIVNLTTGLRTLDPRIAELGRVLGMGYSESLVRLRMPALLPTFFSSLKIAGPAAFVAAIIAEWLGADAGIGVALTNAMFGFRIPQLWALLVVSTLLNAAIILLMDRLGRLAAPWHESSARRAT